MTTTTRRRPGSARRLAACAVAAAMVLQQTLWLGAQAQAPTPSQGTPPPGWVFTPAIAVAESWDNNVLLATEGSESAGDFATAVSPRGVLGYRGRYTDFNLDYRGSYQFYQELTELNAYDQRANASFTRRLSPALNVFARNSLTKSPTTDDVDVPGVRFRRQGVLLEDFRAGLEARLDQRTAITGAYNFQYVDFDDDEALVTVDGLRRGGHAHGGSAQLDHRLSPRLSVGAEYDMRHGTVDEIQTFDVMNALGTVDWQFSRRMAVSAGAGYAWLSTSQTGEGSSAPAFRVSLSRSGEQLAWIVGYRRSFLPSFGFGGTFQNQEFNAGVLALITRRLDVSGSFSVRNNDPLNSVDGAAGDPTLLDSGLRSIWARSSVSYLATRWLRVEGYYTATFQDSQRPGGEVTRARAGIQVVTSTRMRIR
jgi:hypothetical protein